MKWIGQHIWSFISRFRSDVYLEDLTESAQDHVVGVDADGKLYKQDVSTGDITGVDISVGTGLDISQSNTTSGDYSSTISLDLTEVGVNGSNNQLLTDNGNGTISSESALSFDARTLSVGDLKIYDASTTTSYNGSTYTSYIQFPSYEIVGDVGIGGIIKVEDADGADEKGAALVLESGDANGTNMDGGDMRFYLGTRTGSGGLADFLFYGSDASAKIATLNDSGLKLDIADQAIIFEGGTYDTTLKAATSPSGSAKTITLPDATGTVALTSDITNTTLNGTTAGGIATYASANTLDIETKLTWDGDDMLISSATSQKPVVEIKNTNTDGQGPELKLNNTKGDNDGADGDYAGKITFNAMDDDGGGSSQATQQYGRIYVRVHDATSTEESGNMLFDVANHDGGLNTALSLVGGSEDGEVDATIGSGSSSSTTVAGDLTVTSKATIPTRKLSITAGSSAGEYDGDVVYTGTTTSMTAGDLYVYNSSGTWTQANAAAEATTKGLLAIALGTASDTDGMLLRGMVTTGTIAGTQDEGATVYIRATAGDITTAAPNSSGQFVRIVGYCMENSNNRMYFNPDGTYIEIA